MSEVTALADAFVSAHLEQARALGERLADLTEEPEAFVVALSGSLEALADPAYLDMVTRACPETPARFAVRGPLSEALMKPVRAALAEGSSTSALRLAQRLIETEHRDLRLYALPCLRRALAQDPEQSWQLMRQLGRKSKDWIAVDSLADGTPTNAGLCQRRWPPSRIACPGPARRSCARARASAPWR